MSQDNVWMAKFGEPPVIHQIHQGYPPPKVYAIQYISLIYIRDAAIVVTYDMS